MKINNFINFSVILYVLDCVLCVVSVDNTTMSLEDAIRKQEEIDKSSSGNALSRRRRYLIFPEGSSLQVVHCLTYGMYLGIADIFYMGVTASLAWQLPQDPYSPFHHHAEALHRNDDGTYVYADENNVIKKPQVGKNVLINKYTGEPIQPYAKNYFDKKYGMKYGKGKKKINQRHHKKIIINPTFAKRSIDNPDESKGEKKRKKKAAVMKIDRKAMHDAQEERIYLKTEHMDWKNVEFHRQSRSQLYEKIEKFIRGIGHDGRHCVLKSLCEMGQDKEPGQRPFIEEILRAVFTLPSGSQFKSKHHQEYDKAHSTMKNCEELYPKCTKSIKTAFK